MALTRGFHSGRMHAEAEMNECALRPRNGAGRMYAKGRGGRTGWKAQLRERRVLSGRQRRLGISSETSSLGGIQSCWLYNVILFKVL